MADSPPPRRRPSAPLAGFGHSGPAHFPETRLLRPNNSSMHLDCGDSPDTTAAPASSPLAAANIHRGSDRPAGGETGAGRSREAPGLEKEDGQDRPVSLPKGPASDLHEKRSTRRRSREPGCVGRDGWRDNRRKPANRGPSHTCRGNLGSRCGRLGNANLGPSLIHPAKPNPHPQPCTHPP